VARISRAHRESVRLDGPSPQAAVSGGWIR
jgi:hypothetical protein